MRGHHRRLVHLVDPASPPAPEVTLPLVPSILAGVVLLAAAIAAVPTLWRALRAAARVPSILEGVAAEFSPNGGHSLRDSIDRLSEAADRQASAFETHMATDEQFVDYAHARFHKVMNDQQKIWLLLTLPREERDEFARELLRRRATDPPTDPQEQR